jgi:hypothetical protein
VIKEKLKIKGGIIDKTPENLCSACKHLRYCYYTNANVCSIECKKGFKVVDATKPFACGEFRLRKGWKI